MYSIFFRIVIIFALQSSALTAQLDEEAIILGQHITKDISRGGRHVFRVDLERGQFAHFELEQMGVDLVVKTIDAKGRLIKTFDSALGKYGPEYFSLTSKKKGSYRIVVQPYKSGLGGNYRLYYRLLRPAAQYEEGKIDELFMPNTNDDSPGVAVAISRGDEILFKKGYGMANLEYDIPVTPSTIFHVASVSKQFTAFAILLLEEEGKLRLDDDVRKYIPEVPDFGKTITLRHLAYHTSGLRDQFNLLALAGWRLDDVITKEHILKLVSLQKELNFDPGEEFLYCNTGYTLLAEVVERVSGTSFEEFTRIRIFNPLNMIHSFFYDDHETIVKNRAYSYHRSIRGFKKNVLSYATVGATSLFSTVEDLSRWSMNFHQPKIGDAELIDKLTRPGTLNNGDPTNYALGLGIGVYKGLAHIGHGGADAGYRSYLGVFPIQDFAVVVLSNDAAFDAEAKARKLSDIYLSETMKLTDLTLPSKKIKWRKKRVKIDVNTLKLYEGEYELQPGLIIAISRRGDRLFAKPTGQGRSELIPIAASKFEDEFSGAKISFHRSVSQEIDRMTVSQGKQNMDAKKLEPFDSSSVKLSEYTGLYYSEELLTTYEIVLHDQSLIAKHQRNGDIALRPVRPERFKGNTWYFRELDFERNQDGEVSACRVSNGRVRNLLFKKIPVETKIP